MLKHHGAASSTAADDDDDMRARGVVVSVVVARVVVSRQECPRSIYITRNNKFYSENTFVFFEFYFKNAEKKNREKMCVFLKMMMF